ncbi:MAG: RtcB family protein [Nanoarchaeota archaeon]|nr:RtcB family protein [Nanoarchaeota archaeon]
MDKNDLVKIEEGVYELPMKGEMRVPGRIFITEDMLESIDERTLKQVSNVAKLPGIQKYSYGMSDIHCGYGFPIGGVAAFDLETGVISPGGVGYDINCSVRLLRTNLVKEDLKGRENEIMDALFDAVPTGTGRVGKLKINFEELDSVLINGAKFMVERGYGTNSDLEFTEDNGCLIGGDPKDVSRRAKERGMPQLGSLGAGNHFLDILVVSEIFDKKTAEVYGLLENMVVVLIHCGSRGLGHQVASDYIKLMDEKYGHPEFDRELVHAPIGSLLGQKYLSAMRCAANFAFANKQLITHNVREAMKKFFPEFKMDVVADICHNIAKIEKHMGRELLIMRKGATRSFGPKRKEIPSKYRGVGYPILIPGSMGTSSYVLAGTNRAEEISFGSTAHGAGREKSRTEARANVTYESAVKNMKDLGVYVKSRSHKGIIEEAPSSYKDVSEVVRVSDSLGIGKKVVRLDPLIVVIG